MLKVKKTVSLELTISVIIPILLVYKDKLQKERVMNKVKGVIMAGGFGTRMQPLTHSTPKPMVPVMNIPMMEYMLENLIKAGINEIVILLYFLPDVVKDYFKDGSKWNVKIDYVLPDADYGTAGAVKKAKEFLDTTFIVVSGDVITDFDLSKIIDFHFKKSSKLTIGLTSVDNPLQFGVVIANSDGKIEKFLEKPSWGEVFSDTINTGIYVIEPDILDFVPSGESFDFAKNLFPLLMKEGIDLMGYTLDGYWRDVGNPDSYREVHKDIFFRRVNIKPKGRKIEFAEGVLYALGDFQLGDNVKIIDTVVIDDGVTVEKNSILSNVCIGKNSKIGKDCNLRNSIIWHKAEIGDRVVMDNAVICNDVKVGNGVKAKAGVILAEACDVGQLATFEHDIVVWPNKKIDAASIVKNNIIWGSRFKNTLFENGIINGKTNIELSCDVACKIGEAFGSQLPVGSKVLVGRDYSAASRMIKRAFVSGLLATGIVVVDMKSIPLVVLRHAINRDNNIVAGAYFKRDLYDPSAVELILFNEYGLKLDTNSSKAVDKSFFKEEFRRVDYKQIGKIIDNQIIRDEKFYKYSHEIERLIDHKIIRESNIRVVVDLFYGITKDIFPYIMTMLQIDNITLNAYTDEIKLANISHYESKNLKDISTMVKSLTLDFGILIYPYSQRRILVDDKGEVLSMTLALNAVLDLMNKEAKRVKRKMKILLPSWSADLNDDYFDNLIIMRGNYMDFGIEQLKNFDMIAKVDGNCAFPEFSLYRDAIFSSLKLMELLAKNSTKLSELGRNIQDFFYKSWSVACPQLKKGKIMKRFLDEAKKKQYSTVDGIKVWESNTDWIMVMPDPYSEQLNIYIQAINDKKGMEIYEHYITLINNWLKES